MSNPVTVSDLEARWRPLSPDEAIVAQAILDDAWDTLRLRSPSLEARYAAGDVGLSTIRRVVCAMTLRVLRDPAPDGVLYSETIGNYSYQRSRAAGTAAELSGLYVTDAELALLTPLTLAGAFTIRQVAVPT